MYCKIIVMSLSWFCWFFILGFLHRQFVGFLSLLLLHFLEQKNAEEESNCIFVPNLLRLSQLWSLGENKHKFIMMFINGNKLIVQVTLVGLK